MARHVFMGGARRGNAPSGIISKRFRGGNVLKGHKFKNILIVHFSV